MECILKAHRVAILLSAVAVRTTGLISVRRDQGSLFGIVLMVTDTATFSILLQCINMKIMGEGDSGPL
jgi:hypothetical protein